MSAEIDKLKSEIETLKAENADLRNRIEEAATSGAKIAVPVPGTFTVELETPSGKKVKQKIKFKDGRVRCAINGDEVSSTALINIANGKKVDEQVLELFPALRSIDKDAAQAHLTWLASIQSGIIEKA